VRPRISRVLLGLLVLATLALGVVPEGAAAAARALEAASPCASYDATTTPDGACDSATPTRQAGPGCCGTDEPCCCVEAPAAPPRPPAPTAPARSSEQGPSLALAAPEANRAAPPLAPEARGSTSPSAPEDAALTGFAASPAERRLHLRQALLLD